jgi:imidazoleglycerol-phosphate dehydratase
MKNDKRNNKSAAVAAAKTEVKTEVKPEVKAEIKPEVKAETKPEPKNEIILSRKTKETDIQLGLRIKGDGKADINSGVGFFDHMLEGFAKHGNFDLKIICKGDLNVDSHHTVEDIGIVLGQAIKQGAADKAGINRYATFIQPMDDALVLVSVDLCGRTYLGFDYVFPVERVGYFETETVKEFFRAVADNAGMNIHVKVLDGENTHHIIEAMFKAFANALSDALSDSGRTGIKSTKGVL